MFSSTFNHPICTSILFSCIRLIGKHSGRYCNFVNKCLTVRIVQGNVVLFAWIQCEAYVKRTAIRHSVCPEQDMLAGFYQRQYISFRNRIFGWIVFIVRQIAAFDIYRSKRGVEYFYPSIMQAVIILIVLLIGNQYFIDFQACRSLCIQP